jgi:hypothetical protein
MTLETIYALVSAGLLAFVAAIWSGEGLFNIAMKMLFTLVAFSGAIVVARALAL